MTRKNITNIETDFFSATIKPVQKIGLTTFFFLFIIFLVPTFWLFRGNNPQENSLIEGRYLKKFSLEGLGFKAVSMELISGKTHEALYKLVFLLEDRSLQTQLEKASSDQFPLRIPAIRTAKAIDRLAISLVYTHLPDLIIPAAIQVDSGLFIFRDESGFIFRPKRMNEQKKIDINYRIDNYIQMINNNPQINFYLFYVERIAYSRFNPMNQYFFDADKGRALAYFEQNKPEALTLGKMTINSFDDYINYYYKTDHHWNIHGALVAYHGVYQLLKENFPEISAPLEIEHFITLPDVSFAGSSARMSFYPIKGEAFEIADFDLPLFKTYQNGHEIEYSKSAQYMDGDYSREPYINHYGEFFGYDRPMMELVFDNQSNRQLLIIGDSFDNAIVPLVASHYEHTFIVDLRQEDFSLHDFLTQHPVDDILIVGDNEVAFDSKDWLIKP